MCELLSFFSSPTPHRLFAALLLGVCWALAGVSDVYFEDTEQEDGIRLFHALLRPGLFLFISRIASSLNIRLSRNPNPKVPSPRKSVYVIGFRGIMVNI